MGNANDRRQVERAGRIEKGVRRTELEEVRYLMATPLGRALMHRVLEYTGTERPAPFTSNAMALSRDNGVQSVGYWLLAELREACPELEIVMRREAQIQAQRVDMQEELNDNDDR